MLDSNLPRMKGFGIFMIGAILGLFLVVAAFLQDTESIVFSALVSGDETLHSLSCPAVITTSETGTVSAKMTNPSDRPIERSVRTHITQGYLTYIREFQEKYPLQPGDSKIIEWTVYPEDAAYGYLVLVKVFMFPNGTIPSAVGACGIVVLDFPYLKGWQILAVWIAASILPMGIGLREYYLNNRPIRNKKLTLMRSLSTITATLILGFGSIFIENWYTSLFLSIFTIILIAESLFYYSQIYFATKDILAS